MGQNRPGQSSKQEQAPNLPISLLGNSLTLFHPEPVSVLLRATSEQHVPLREWPLTRVSLPQPAPGVLLLCLGATFLFLLSVLAPFGLRLELDRLNCPSLVGEEELGEQAHIPTRSSSTIRAVYSVNSPTCSLSLGRRDPAGLEAGFPSPRLLGGLNR